MKKIQSVDCSEKQSHSYVETANTKSFDGPKPCDCPCHLGRGVMCMCGDGSCGGFRAPPPYESIYCEDKSEIEVIRKKKEKKHGNKIKNRSSL